MKEYPGESVPSAVCGKALSGEHVWQPSPFQTGQPTCKNCGIAKPIDRYKVDAAGRIVPVKAPKPSRPKRSTHGKPTMQEAIKRHLEHVLSVHKLGVTDDPFVPAWDLRSREIDLGEGVTFWVGTSGDRRARELAEAGEIIVERRQGFAYYAAKGANQPVLS